MGVLRAGAAAQHMQHKMADAAQRRTRSGCLEGLPAVPAVPGMCVTRLASPLQ